MSDSDRLEAIEIKLAHLERAMLELSDVLVRQQREIDRSVERNQRLASLIEALEASASSAAPADEKPPHY